MSETPTLDALWRLRLLEYLMTPRYIAIGSDLRPEHFDMSHGQIWILPQEDA